MAATGGAAAADSPRATGAPASLRIVVVGSSVGYYIRPYRRNLAERTYAEHTEAMLRAAGVPAFVFNSSRWTATVRDVNRNIESLVYTHAPDVVVVNLGILECEPRTIPMWLLRWLFTHAPSMSRPARALRRVLAPPLMKAYIEGSPRILRRVHLSPRMRAGRFRRELEQLVSVVRRERGALVLLLGITPPGRRLESVLPGTAANAERYTKIIKEVASRPGARFIEVPGEAADELVPDGIHFAPEGHKAIAGEIAAEVVAWLGEAREDPVL